MGPEQRALCPSEMVKTDVTLGSWLQARSRGLGDTLLFAAPQPEVLLAQERQPSGAEEWGSHLPPLAHCSLSPPSAVPPVGLCQEWSQVLHSWISSVIWAAALRSEQIYWQRMRLETWEPRSCHHGVGLPCRCTQLHGASHPAGDPGPKPPAAVPWLFQLLALGGVCNF